MTKITKKAIKTQLLKSLFDPKNISFKTVIEMERADYCKMKAIELIRESMHIDTHGTYHDNLQQAISLLALAKVMHEKA